jgi:phage gp37-like protein
MAEIDWIEMEDAVLGALTAQLGSLVQTLETYQGDWQSDLQQASWRFPACLVILKRAEAEQVAMGSYDLTLDFTVLVAARQLRGEAAGRRGTGGVYEILAGVRQALWHQDLGLNLLPFSLIREEPLLNNREFTVFAAHYRTGTVKDF